MTVSEHKSLIEYAIPQTARSLVVDREKGVIRGVKILGQKSRNGNFYTERAMRDAASLYEEVAVYDGHHTRKYSDHVGTLRSAYYESGAVYGDLHLRKHHGLYESIINDAETDPGNLALSHEVKDGDFEYTMTPDYRQVDSIARVDAVAIVKTGGTNVSLVEEKMADSKPKVETIEQLKVAYPDLVEQLSESLKEDQDKSDKTARVIAERNEARSLAESLQEKLDLIEEERRVEALKAEIKSEAKELKLAEDAIDEDLMEEFVGMKREMVTAFLKNMKPAEEDLTSAPESTSGNAGDGAADEQPFYSRG